MMPVSYESELERSGKIIITVKGVSMRPLFRADSDAIIVKRVRVEKLKNLDIVLFMRPSTNGIEYVLHRIVGRRPDGCFIIAGDNCIGVDIVPPKAVLGVAVSAQRSGKPIKLSGMKYSAYKNLWCKPYKLRSFILRCRNKLRSAARRLLGKRRI